MSMDDSISAFCAAFSAFLSHLQSTSDALSHSLRRRPIPLDSAAASFVGRLSQRVAAAAADLELLDDMAMGTVSVAELLGHCTEVYRCNQAYIDLLQDHLATFGYVPPAPEIDSDDGESEGCDVDSKLLSPEDGLMLGGCGGPAALGAASARRRLDEDHLFDGSATLQNMGLSDACLATLASEAKNDTASPRMHPGLVSSNNSEMCKNKMLYHSSSEVFHSKGVPQDDVILDKCAGRASIEISKEDYDRLPTYVKSLASWEDLQEAVTKMNSGLCKRDTSEESGSLSQDDLDTLGLGRKGKSCILALIRMNRLAVETVGGSVVYRIVNDRNM